MLQEWGPRGPFALRVHADSLRDPRYPSCVDPLGEASRRMLRSALHERRWVIITIVPLPHPGRAHAIALIGITEDDLLLVLDPATATESQPTALSEDELARLWTGEIIVCAAFP